MTFKEWRSFVNTHPVMQHKSVVVSLLVFALAIPLTIGAGFEEQNSQNNAAAPVPSVTLPFQPITEQHTVHLTKGWNLISLPLVPKDPIYASQLLNQIVDNKDAAVGLEVELYTNGAYQTFIPGKSQDFPIPYEVGFAVLVSNDGTFSEIGGTNSNQTPVQLTKGFNLIGIPSSNFHTARDVMASMQTAGLMPVKIEQGSDPNPLVANKTLSVSPNGKYIGEDFPIIPGIGYFIEINKAGVWSEK